MGNSFYAQSQSRGAQTKKGKSVSLQVLGLVILVNAPTLLVDFGSFSKLGYVAVTRHEIRSKV